MIESINNEAVLANLHRDLVEENGVNVVLDKDFYLEDETLDRSMVSNLSVDTYYNSLGLQETPPSPDNLIVINRGKGKYCIYIVELKCVSKMRSVKAENIKKKFETAINDFMSERFPHIFLDEQSKLTQLTLWLVCNRFGFIGSNISEDEYLRRVRGGVMEALLLSKPYKFRDKFARVELMLSGKELI